MTTYWAIFIIPAVASLMPYKSSKTFSDLQLALFGALLVLVIGYRHEVGGDWVHYMHDNTLYASLKSLPLLDIFVLENISQDIGFLVVHWLSQNLFNGIYTTNLIAAVIFVSGLVRLCKNLPLPWHAMTIAVPYLVVVVAMGYTRQSVAIGLVMWGLVDLMLGNRSKFYISIILAALFHKTALIMMVVGLIEKGIKSRRLDKSDFIIVLGFIVFIYVIRDKLDVMVFHYITNTSMESAGALVRLLMSVVAAIGFFIYRKKWNIVYSDGHIWGIISIVVLAMLPLVFITSTLVDRIAIYFLPIQMVFFSRVTHLIADNNIQYIVIVGIITVYFGVMFVWLIYGAYSTYWIPYNNLLFL